MKYALLLFILLIAACGREPIITPIGDAVLLYNARSAETYEIWKFEDGIETPLVQSNDYDHWWARVVPDKSKFLCYRSPLGGRPDNDYENAELWVFNMDGSGGHKIIDLADYGWRSQGVADWSPDGSKLVMAAEARDPNDNDNFHWHLFVTDFNGNNAVRISTRPTLYADPSWSPDGDKIVYCAFPEGFNQFDPFLLNLEIHTAELSNDLQLINEQRHTFDELRDHDPYWSPNGRYLAFETIVEAISLSKLLGVVDLRMVDLNTNQVQTILHDGNVNTVPSWTADSETVYFHRVDYSVPTPFYIAKVNIDGTGLEDILYNHTISRINPHVFY